jgi:hypothetical protein
MLRTVLTPARTLVRPLVRPWAAIAAAATLGVSCPSLAAPLAGRVATPSDVVPALVVHAWSKTSGRAYSVTTAVGQTSYSLEVPPGRYVVFAAPADPGAPPVYGAHTRFSLCARDAKSLESGACRDHGLIEVEVAAKRIEGVDVTDWYLDDATVAQLDAALGRAAEAVEEAQLAAPKFSEYPAVRLAAVPRAAALQPEPDPRLERDRTALTTALAGAPTFAGRFAIVHVPCSGDAAARPDCDAAAILDLPLGRAVWPAALNPLPAAGPCTDRGVLQYRRDSRLLTITARDGEQLVTRYYVWDGEAARLTLVATLASAIGSRCTVVAPAPTPAASRATHGAGRASAAP